MNHFAQTNGIQLHYLDFQGHKPTITSPMILMHGLTANAHAFDGLINAGLNTSFRIISVDLRGRGLSDKPPKGYSMAEHAQDMIGLLDSLHLEKVMIAGHSFGGLLGLYLAIHFPERVEKLILMDAAAKMHPDTRELLIPAMSRLGQKVESFEKYIENIRQMPFIGEAWEDSMLSYFKADVQENEDGTVIPHSKIEHIVEAVQAVLGEPWLDYIASVKHPSVLINATEPYGTVDKPPLLPKEFALETVQMMQNCQYVGVSGNHQTMLYGKGAREIVEAISGFIKSK
jgi:pimeloyl-ACP methyl ester carboxylesterase